MLFSRIYSAPAEIVDLWGAATRYGAEFLVNKKGLQADAHNLFKIMIDFFLAILYPKGKDKVNGFPDLVGNIVFIIP